MNMSTSLEAPAPSRSSILTCSESDLKNNQFIKFVAKWNDGILNRNWSREHYWLTPEIDNGIFELYRIGVPASHLLKAGYEFTELINGGYSENELIAAGYKLNN